MSTLDRFSGKAEGYAKYRPAYPDSLYDYLYREGGFGPESVIADVGAGTGIFSRGLLSRGSRVFAVEPNADMRGQAVCTLGGCANFVPTDGTAEHTGLADRSVDFVTVAQAFHWFDPDAFARECRRILRLGGRAALVWNSRAPRDVLSAENDALCRKLCPAFHGFSGGNRDFTEAYARFFRDGRYGTRVFDNPISYDRASFVGRCLSSSYAPRESDGHYAAYVAAMEALFDKYAENGVYVMANETRLSIGEV